MAAILSRGTPIGTPVVVQGHASAARAEAPIRLGQRVLESGHSELWDRGAWADRAQRTVESVRRAIQPAPVQAQPPVRRGQTQYLYY